MNKSIEQLQETIAPLRRQIIQHPVYASIGNMEDLAIFMQYHVYAVWDFMSLLKSLQARLTCTSVPWFPVGSGETRYLINEIVAGEESDVNAFGVRKSHFELYLDAMQQCDADTTGITTFIAALQNGDSFAGAYEKAATPAAARHFVNNTFSVIHSGKDYLASAVFTFGREDLIPNMFHAIINDLNDTTAEGISIFKYYLDRHIEVDGDHHSPLALQMTANLCGTDEQKWKEVVDATLVALQSRIALWDGACNDIRSRQQAKQALVPASLVL